MAQQTINIGTTANDGTGDPLRTAFDKANDNFTELYGAGSLSLASDIITFTKANGTTSTIDISAYLDEDARAISSGVLNSATGIVTFTRDDASTFTLDLSALLDDTNLVTSVNAQTGAVVLDSDDIAEGSTNLYNQSHTGDVTGSTALTIANSVVTLAKLDTNLIVPEAAGIAANDNDTTIPTSAAVKDYVDGAVPTYTDFYVTGNLGYDSTDYITWTDNTQMDFYVNGLNNMRLQSNADLHVDGDVVAYSTTISDERLKDDIQTIDNALDKVDKLRGVSYVWNDGKRKGEKDLGVIAQEVEAVFPELVREKEMPMIDGKTYKTVDYEKLVGVLIESVKELKREIEILKAK